MKEIIIIRYVRKMLIIMFFRSITIRGHVCPGSIDFFLLHCFFVLKGPSVVLPTGRRAIRQPVRLQEYFFLHEHKQGYYELITSVYYFSLFICNTYFYKDFFIFLKFS